MKTIVTYKQNEIDLFEYIESKSQKAHSLKILSSKKWKERLQKVSIYQLNIDNFG